MICITDFTSTADKIHITSEGLEELNGQDLKELPELNRFVVKETFWIKKNNFIQAKP
jgi:hypothetical protein